MNKILIALVLAVVMSGNAYSSHFKFLNHVGKELCIKVLEGGSLVESHTGKRLGDPYYFHYYIYEKNLYKIEFQQLEFSDEVACRMGIFQE